MESTINCFKGITRENVYCQHSTCSNNHISKYIYNETCSHGDLEKVATLTDIQNWVMNEKLNKDEMNALLSGIFILEGGCTCKFSWEILNFFADILAYTSTEKFEIIIDNWTVKQYLDELPGLWGREEIIKTRLYDLATKGKKDRLEKIIYILEPKYYRDEDTIPYIFDFEGSTCKI